MAQAGAHRGDEYSRKCEQYRMLRYAWQAGSTSSSLRRTARFSGTSVAPTGFQCSYGAKIGNGVNGTAISAPTSYNLVEVFGVGLKLASG